MAGAGSTAGAVVRSAAPPQEEMSPSESDALHERLVAYVHTIAHGSRRGVWGEHSYARARIGGGGGGGAGGGGGGAPRVRVLLAPRPRAASPEPDVERPPEPEPEPPAEPGAPAAGEDDDGDDTDASDDGEWEARVAAAAPGPAHARLADAAADALRRMRLARLAGGGRAARREQARAAAARLRRALAPLWGPPGPGWLHAALVAHLPRAERRLYEEALAELGRAVPRLAARLSGAAPAPGAPPAARAVGPESSPWLVWVASGSAALDARVEPRLAALVHTRVLRGAAGAAGAGALPPEPWCAAAAAAVRSALTDALAEAGSRCVVLGGAGAGCAVALLLARGAGAAGRAGGGVRGLLLLAPALDTAEAARDAPDDALRACRLPLLIVAGSAAADCTRAVAHNVAGAGAGAGGGGGARRLLEVRGADHELRLPPRLRARLRLPQPALDAALVEECVRWAVETAEQEEEPPSPSPSPAPPRARPLPTVVREIDLTDEEYAHLPPAAPAPPAPAAPLAPPAPLHNRSLESACVSRVVSRVSGGTPLALLPPRRAPSAPSAPPAPPAPLAAADIMQLPIVFADDAPATPATDTGPETGGAGGAGGALTVTSGKPQKRVASEDQEAGADEGSVKFTRVILAKRGARGGGGGAPRRLLLRRGVRLVPRPS